jgi:hypothetical protein
MDTKEVSMHEDRSTYAMSTERKFLTPMPPDWVVHRDPVEMERLRRLSVDPWWAGREGAAARPYRFTRRGRNKPGQAVIESRDAVVGIWTFEGPDEGPPCVFRQRFRDSKCWPRWIRTIISGSKGVIEDAVDRLIPCFAGGEGRRILFPKTLGDVFSQAEGSRKGSKHQR